MHGRRRPAEFEEPETLDIVAAGDYLWSRGVPGTMVFYWLTAGALEQPITRAKLDALLRLH
jgi:hypothetical protein